MIIHRTLTYINITITAMPERVTERVKTLYSDSVNVQIELEIHHHRLAGDFAGGDK